MRVSSNSYLCSSSEVLDFVLSLSPKNREPAKYDYGGTRKYVLMGATQPIFTSFLREKFNVNHMLSRDERIGSNEWEHFIIGTTSSDGAMVNSYLNNMGLLDKFVAYFRNKANKLIDNACKNSFKSGRPMQKCSFCGPQSLSDNYGLGNLSTIPEPTHYTLISHHTKKVVIPKSEMHCLIMLSQGRSAKEIAQTFNISPRTVESYIVNAKLRLGCDNKRDLLNIIEMWKRSNVWAL
jgi:DNA-binding CsgD family transcriptional regulator